MADQGQDDFRAWWLDYRARNGLMQQDSKIARDAWEASRDRANFGQEKGVGRDERPTP